MGELNYDGLQFFINGKPLYFGDFGCGSITMSSPNDVERFAKLKSELDTMTEKYKPIADKLVEEIYKSSQNAPLLFTNSTTRKVRKRYKPKFTL